MRSLVLLSAAALAVSDASTDQTLILGKSSSPLWHETRSSGAFSAAGMADLALNSLGLSTGRVSSRSAVQSPLQADIFTHSDAYAMILLEDASSTTLDAVNAALTAPKPSTSCIRPNPQTTALCASVSAEKPQVNAELVLQVLKANSFLSATDEQDVAFAQRLAQVMQLTTELQQTQGKKLFLVGLSGLQGDKQRAAQQAVTTTVTEFLAQLMKTEQTVAAQIMTGTLPTVTEETAALSRRNRKLVTKLSNEEEDDEESEEGEGDEEEEVEDLAAASGSVWEDEDNSTSASNSTAPGAVSMPDIAEYQIILWTSVLLGVVLLMAIMAMVNMDAGRDSLLYAKFIADSLDLWAAAMKNHPRDEGDDPETGNDEPGATPESTAEEFRARCARMRENTERELARLAQRRADVRAQIGVTSATMEQSELDASTQEKIRDLFDNEMIWDADDTDGYIIQVFQELEAVGANIATLKDQGWNTLLHTASLWNRSKIAEELIRRGAPLNEKNKNGHTPLDLAMHWGHFDMGQQLRHYGGKHTCERNAISQFHSGIWPSSSSRIQVEDWRSAVSSLTKERDALYIQAAQLQSELVCEQTARNNAVHSWKMAEKVIAELQQIQEECREREEEALRLRNEAIHDRDVARERAKEAQLDQGIAKQNQLELERERDQAIERLLQNESQVMHDKEKWRKLMAKIALERRNIQIEIDRQTEILRSENAKLEKSVATLSVVNTRQKADLERSQLTILTLEKQLGRHKQELGTASEQSAKLKEQVGTLLEERRLEYKSWRAQLEIKMQQELSDDLKRILGAVITTWKALQTCQQHMTTSSASRAGPRASSPSHTPAIMSAIFQNQRPHTSAEGPGFLPFIQEAPPTGLKGSSSTPVLFEPSQLSGIVSDAPPAVFTDREQATINYRAQAEAALQELTIGMTSEQIVQLCAFVQTFVGDVTTYISANLQRLRLGGEHKPKRGILSARASLFSGSHTIEKRRRSDKTPLDSGSVQYDHCCNQSARG
ncbi:Ankyrin repeat-containing domain [Phytophthora cactorum]|nr:Ankyrin repeat-containing domain [Phytophthora cactorum]